MVLSRRERYVLIGTVIVVVAVVAVVALVLDRFALTPVPEGLSETEARKPDAPSEANQSEALLVTRQQMAPKWREMLKSGMKGDPAAAESQVLHAIRDWAEASGLALSAIKPERLTKKGGLTEIAFQAVGTGTMDSVHGLLWRVQTASIPIRATELHLAARKEGTDDLSVQLRLSTVYVPAPPKPATAPLAVEVPALWAQPDDRRDPVAEARELVDNATFARGWYDRRPRFLDCMRQVTLAFPEEGGTWVTSLVVREDMQVLLSGKSVSEAAALEVLDRLKGDPRIMDVKRLYIRQTGAKTGEVSFAINFTFRGAG